MIKKLQIKLQQDKELYLRIKVIPKSAKNEITEILEDETVKIKIKAIPKRGKANQELIKFLHKTFQVKKENIFIISGKTDRIKLIKIKLS